MALEVSIFESATLRSEQAANTRRTTAPSGSNGFDSVLSSTKEVSRRHARRLPESNNESARLKKSEESTLSSDLNKTAEAAGKETQDSAVKSGSGTYLDENTGKAVSAGKSDFSETVSEDEVSHGLQGAEPQEAYVLIDDEYDLGSAVTLTAADKVDETAFTEVSAVLEEGLLATGEIAEEPGVKSLLLGNGQEVLLENEIGEVSGEATDTKHAVSAQGSAKVAANVTARFASAKNSIQSELEAGEQAYRINRASILEGNGIGEEAGLLKLENPVPEQGETTIGTETVILKGTDGVEGNGVLSDGLAVGSGSGSDEKAELTGTAPPVVLADGVTSSVSSTVSSDATEVTGIEGNGVLSDGSAVGSGSGSDEKAELNGIAPSVLLADGIASSVFSTVSTENTEGTGIAAPVVMANGVTLPASATGNPVGVIKDGAAGESGTALLPEGVSDGVDAPETVEGALNAENKELLQAEVGSEKRGAGSTTKGGLTGTVESLRERTEPDITVVKKTAEQAEVAKEFSGKGGEANVKAVAGVDKGVKNINTGSGALSGLSSGSALGALSDLTGGGTEGDGDENFGQNRPQDFSALLAREGQLKNVTVTEAYSSASTGGNAAKGVENTVKVYEKFAQAIKLSFLAGGKNVTLRLSPAHLGALQIKLHSDGKSVKAKILVDSLAVKQLLESDTGKLKQLFLEQGLNMEEYTVALQEHSVGSDGSSGTDLWQRHAGNGSNATGRKAELEKVDDAVIHSVMNRAYGMGRAGGVDLFA